MTRYHRATGEVDQVRPHGNYRYLRTAPLMFSEVDPHVLFLGTQMVLKTTNGGRHLAGHQPRPFARTYAVPASVAAYADAAKRQSHAPRRGLRHRAFAPERATSSGPAPTMA